MSEQTSQKHTTLVLFEDYRGRFLWGCTHCGSTFDDTQRFINTTTHCPNCDFPVTRWCGISDAECLGVEVVEENGT
jgi:hypothetical protein